VGLLLLAGLLCSSRKQNSGACSGGLTITVLPAASGARDFHAGEHQRMVVGDDARCAIGSPLAGLIDS
jgi:hypothetical protein